MGPIIYSKTILIGKYAPGRSANCDVELKITLREAEKGTELSICANVWNHLHTDGYAFGQLQEGVREYLTKPLIPATKLNRILEIWNRWHLNGLQAGCEHQRVMGVEAFQGPTGYGGPTPCLVCGYRYGSAWLHEALPAEIIEEVKSW